MPVSCRDAGALREREVEQLRESCSSLASQLAAFKQRQREQEQQAVLAHHKLFAQAPLSSDVIVPDIVPRTDTSGGAADDSSLGKSDDSRGKCEVETPDASASVSPDAAVPAPAVSPGESKHEAAAISLVAEDLEKSREFILERPWDHFLESTSLKDIHDELVRRGG